jgi:hypothetical protein
VTGDLWGGPLPMGSRQKAGAVHLEAWEAGGLETLVAGMSHGTVAYRPIQLP